MKNRNKIRRSRIFKLNSFLTLQNSRLLEFWTYYFFIEQFLRSAKMFGNWETAWTLKGEVHFILIMMIARKNLELEAQWTACQGKIVAILSIDVLIPFFVVLQKLRNGDAIKSLVQPLEIWVLSSDELIFSLLKRIFISQIKVSFVAVF